LLLKLFDACDDGPALLDVFPVMPAGEFLKDETEHGKGTNENTGGSHGKRQIQGTDLSKSLTASDPEEMPP
jgi:hypothetical protein